MNELRLTWLTAVLVAVVAIAVPGAAQAPPTLQPIDEGTRDRDFLAFRTRLFQAIERRDVPALLEAVHPDIKNTFGDHNGVEAFKGRWRLGNADSELWRELGAILSLGGTFQGADTFVAPYVFSRWPDRFDSFEHGALVGTNIRIRSAPNTRAMILATLTHAVLQLDSSGERDSWTKVQLPGGRSGFVASRLVRSPVDYRAFFVRTNGRWQMTTLIAGD